MIIIIPGELISLLTFPGVVLHEIAHRFFCDINDVPVYEIRYFRLLSRRAGHVIHADTPSLGAGLAIAFAPLIINSLVCMLLTIPLGYAAFLGTGFALKLSMGQILLLWLGYSIGFNAIPSNQDVHGLQSLAKSFLSEVLVFSLQSIVYVFNLPFVGFWLQIGYALLLSVLLPKLLLG